MRRELFEDVLKSPRYVKAREEAVRRLAVTNWPSTCKINAEKFASETITAAEHTVAEALGILLDAGKSRVLWSSPEGLKRFVEATFHYVALKDKYPPPYGDSGCVYYALRDYLRCLGYSLYLCSAEYSTPAKAHELLKAVVYYRDASERLNSACNQFNTPNDWVERRTQ